MYIVHCTVLQHKRYQIKNGGENKIETKLGLTEKLPLSKTGQPLRVYTVLPKITVQVKKVKRFFIGQLLPCKSRKFDSNIKSLYFILFLDPNRVFFIKKIRFCLPLL